MNLGFILREGLRGLRRNATMTVALIITTAISLALLGAGILVGKMTEGTKEIYFDRVEVMVQFDEEVSAADTECTTPECADVRQALEDNEDVDSVTFRSQEESYERFVELFSESDPMLVEEASPDALPAALHVRLADPTDITPIEEIEGMPGVDRIVDQSEDVRGMTDILDTIRNATFILAAVQLIAAVMLIANMIVLSAYHRREEIGIMRIVGASRSMTNAPFVIEAVVATFIGAVIGGAGLLAGNQFVARPALSGLYDSGLIARIGTDDVLTVMPLVGVGAVVLAGLVAWVTLRITARK